VQLATSDVQIPGNLITGNSPRQFPGIFPRPGIYREYDNFFNDVHMFKYLIKLIVVNDPNDILGMYPKVLFKKSKTSGLWVIK